MLHQSGPLGSSGGFIDGEPIDTASGRSYASVEMEEAEKEAAV